MACQKICKQGWDDIIVKVNIQSLIPACIIFTPVCNCNVKPSLLYHPYLVYILFGMLSLHLFTFLLFFFGLVSVLFFYVNSQLQLDPKNISFKCNCNPRTTALTIQQWFQACNNIANQNMMKANHSPELRTKLFVTNLLNFNHMTTGQLQQTLTH